MEAQMTQFQIISEVIKRTEKARKEAARTNYQPGSIAYDEWVQWTNTVNCLNSIFQDQNIEIPIDN